MQSFKKDFLAVAALLFTFTSFAEAESLGRLFFTPLERRQLDLRREQFPVTTTTIKPLPKRKHALVPLAAPAATGNAAVPIEKTTVINGFVRRSDGPNTVWLDEKPVSGGAAREEWLQPSAVNSPVRVQISR